MACKQASTPEMMKRSFLFHPFDCTLEKLESTLEKLENKKEKLESKKENKENKEMEASSQGKKDV